MKQLEKASRKNEKVRELFEKLKHGVQEVFNRGRLQELLRFQAKFHKYSFNNTLLILTQRPNATLVAGYNTWKKMGRHVKKGERAIKIFAPLIVKETRENEETGETEEVSKLTGFKVVNVFDISQTEGKPLPCEELSMGDTVRGQELFEVLIRVSPVPVHFESLPMRAKGAFSPDKGVITLSDKLSGDERAAVLLHELAHALAFRLGEQKRSNFGDEEYIKGEVIAEGAAFVAGEYFGLEIPSSFEYVAGWAKDPEKVLRWGEAVQKVASELICLVEKARKEGIAA